MNTALSLAQRKSVPMYKKDDSSDAQCVAKVLINMLNTLPDTIPDDAYWTLGQLVNRRSNIQTHIIRLKNQLHEQLYVAYPSYKTFFTVIDWQTALYFWETYPPSEYLKGKTAEELAEELRPIRHNNCSTKRAEKILTAIKADGDTKRDYQDSRDAITRSLVSDLRHYNQQLTEMEQSIEELLPVFECTLMTMPGIDIITASKMLSEIGNISRFHNADKLAKFAG